MSESKKKRRKLLDRIITYVQDKSFREKEEQVSFAFNIILHVTILLTILVSFFFIYVSKVENDFFREEINTSYRNFLIKNLNSLPEQDKEALKTFLEESPIDLNVVMENNTKQPEYLTINNEYLFVTSCVMISFLIILFIAMYVIFRLSSSKRKIGLSEIFMENFFVFLFVGLVEICFFVFIASKYLPISASLIIKTILDEFNQILGF